MNEDLPKTGEKGETRTRSDGSDGGRQDAPIRVAANVTFVGNGPSESLAIKWVDTLSALLKVIVWPSVLAFTFFLLRAPLVQILGAVPALLRGAKELKYGALAVEIQDQALKIGGPQLAASLNGLSVPAIEKLMLIGGRASDIAAYFWTDASGTQFLGLNFGAADVELANRKLLDLSQAESMISFIDHVSCLNKYGTTQDGYEEYKEVCLISAQDQNQILAARIIVTSAGKQAYDSIVKAIVSQLGTEKQ
jgi:hypothetical protein